MKSNTLKSCHNFLSTLSVIVFILFIFTGESVLARVMADGELYSFTKTPMLVPRKSIQIETAYLYNYKEDYFDQNHASIYARTNPLGYLEFQLGTNTYIPSGKTSDDSEKAVIKEEAIIGLKMNLLRSSNSFSLWQPGVSLVAKTSIFTSQEETTYAPSGMLALSWFLTKLLKGEANIKYAFLEEKKNKYSQVSAGFCLKLYLYDFNPFIEYYSLWPGTYNGQNEQFVNGGVSYNFSKQFMVFIRGGRGVVNTRETYVGFGTSALWFGFY